MAGKIVSKRSPFQYTGVETLIFHFCGVPHYLPYHVYRYAHVNSIQSCRTTRLSRAWQRVLNVDEPEVVTNARLRFRNG